MLPIIGLHVKDSLILVQTTFSNRINHKIVTFPFLLEVIIICKWILYTHLDYPVGPLLILVVIL